MAKIFPNESWAPGLEKFGNLCPNTFETPCGAIALEALC